MWHWYLWLHQVKSASANQGIRHLNLHYLMWQILAKYELAYPLICIDWFVFTNLYTLLRMIKKIPPLIQQNTLVMDDFADHTVLQITLVMDDSAVFSQRETTYSVWTHPKIWTSGRVQLRLITRNVKFGWGCVLWEVYGGRGPYATTETNSPHVQNIPPAQPGNERV